MKYLSINNLSIIYDDLVVLENFNAEFGTGIHWIQGYNGSGKSSLLKALCGINQINKETVKITGFDLVTSALKAKSQLCFVADKPEVYPFMTGIQFLKLIAKIKGTKLTQELYDWLDEINLTQYKDICFSEMSFGTRRKFSLSTVFIGNPQLVLLDEPFNGLDKQTIKQFSLWLTQARKTKCVLVVSHDTHILDSLNDSVTCLD